jgi:hypothetical protein
MGCAGTVRLPAGFAAAAARDGDALRIGLDELRAAARE